MKRIALVPVLIAGLTLAALVLAGCAGEKKPQAQMYSAGEKAPVGNLSFNLVDTQILQQLGDDPANPRTPQNRFILVQVSVTNTGNEESNIPGLSLVDDAGQTFNELPDGAGVQHWLGMVRKVAATQTETGVVLFDAPAQHYRLRLTDEFAPAEVSIDMPLSFLHEQLQHIAPQSDLAPESGAPAGAAPATKK